MMTLRTGVSGVAAAGLVLTAAACGSSGSTSDPGSSGPASVKLYYSIPTAEYSIPMIASDNDLFPDDCDVDVQGGDPTVGLSLVNGGRVQFYVNTAPAIEQVASGGAPLEWAATWQQGVTTEFIARPGIDTLDDLVGKRVGIITPGFTLAVLSNAALRDAGVDVEEVTQVPLGSLPAMNAAFAAGTVDAIVTTTASAVALRDEVPGATTLVDFTDDFDWNGVGVAVNTDYAADNREAVVCVLTGLNRALELLKSDPATASRTIGKVTGLDGPALDAVVESVSTNLTDQLEPVSPETEAFVLEVMRDEGAGWAKEDFAEKVLGDPSYVEEAVDAQ